MAMARRLYWTSIIGMARNLYILFSMKIISTISWVRIMGTKSGILSAIKSFATGV
jgi:hypothetical protein